MDLATAGARVAAQALEGVAHVQRVAGGDDALGLLDDDATVQGVLELVRDGGRLLA